ncbi:hypothetical protein K7I13_12310 [Brucepastera parasyntrophica]|uniref:hypothetical protein n=1 Tax=Brucepastera parasyntrophica TaxID=2880008 RepID=UPI00210C666F|nr:hypothetical protein [Brucepastera parasyntrophica]ULQ59265.1 hypothetical protein K7I13_12310 [Brucepastera parasyntrophica]
MKIEFTDIKKTDYAAVKQLYSAAFPREEQVPFWYPFEKRASVNAAFLNIFDGHIRIGFIYLIFNHDILFIFYLAIDPGLHSKGYRGRGITGIKNKYPGYRIFLNIEAVEGNAANRESRIKRKKFYTTNGFKESGYMFKQNGKLYEILINGRVMSPGEFTDTIKRYLGIPLSLFFTPWVCKKAKDCI